MSLGLKKYFAKFIYQWRRKLTWNKNTQTIFYRNVYDFYFHI